MKFTAGLLIGFLLTALLTFATLASAADVTLAWDANDEPTLAGYKIYMSADQGATWSEGLDVGNVTTHVYTGVPDTGLVLFRVSAYDAENEAIRYEAGAWYCKDWLPMGAPSSVGIQ